MYEFYYNIIYKYWPLNEIICSDTDFLIDNINIYTYDVYKDMKSIEHLFDFSDYPKDHFLYSDRNKKLLEFRKMN